MRVAPHCGPSGDSKKDWTGVVSLPLNNCRLGPFDDRLAQSKFGVAIGMGAEAFMQWALKRAESPQAGNRAGNRTPHQTVDGKQARKGIQQGGRAASNGQTAFFRCGSDLFV